MVQATLFSGTPSLKGHGSPAGIRVLEQRIDSLAPQGVRSCLATAVPEGFELTPGEEACCRAFHARRRLDFVMGRYVAAMALAQLGLAREPILVGPGRAPVWPPSVVGSIAHTQGFAGAVAARDADVLGIGLDIEILQPLADVAEQIATPAETAVAAGHALGEDYWSVLFSAKEAIYKCLWPSLRRFIGFHEVAIRIDDRQGRFAITRHADLGPTADRILGYWFIADGYVVTLAIVARDRDTRLT